ncbi:MAG: carbohydrate ABC transporter permease [Spirochaetales bacterium]|nr:carbohydrate ABC transporter permease [Spirochaetales bacterium]
MNYRRTTKTIISYVLFIACAVIWMLPLFGVIVNSFRPYTNAVGSGWWKVLSEKVVTLSNFKTMVSDSKFLMALKNSALIAIPSVFFAIIVCSMTAFGFIFGKLKHGKKLFSLICALIIIPAEITLLPNLIILKTLNLQSTYPGIWLSHVANIIPFGVFLVGSFMLSLPNDLVEAAEIDGCSKWTTYSKIIFPLSLSAIGSLAIFDFLWVWNDLLRSLVIIPKTSRQPLTVVLANSVGQYGERITIQAAGAVLLMLPPLLVFLLFQKAFINGVLTGAIKS